MNHGPSRGDGPSPTQILTHIVVPVLLVYLFSHKITKRYAVYIFIAVFGSYYGYSTLIKPVFYFALHILSWALLIPKWVLYALRWWLWKIIWGIQALAWFGFYVHFCGYGMKFILECIDRVLIWINEISEEVKKEKQEES